jgi:hypothetical protein
MKAILARQWNRAFSLLRYEPIIFQVAGADHPDVYVRAGDPVGYRNMCADSVAALMGSNPVGVDTVGQYIEVEAFIVPKKNMTAELRRLIINAQNTVEDL